MYGLFSVLIDLVLILSLPADCSTGLLRSISANRPSLGERQDDHYQPTTSVCMSRGEVWYALVNKYIITMVDNLRPAKLGQAQVMIGG